MAEGAGELWDRRERYHTFYCGDADLAATVDAGGFEVDVPSFLYHANRLMLKEVRGGAWLGLNDRYRAREGR